MQQLPQRTPGTSHAGRSRGWIAAAAAWLLVLLLAADAGAQTIRGVVLEEGTTTPVSAAKVELLGLDGAVRFADESDRLGWFQIDVKEAGRYLLRPSHLSYGAASVDTVSVGRHEIVTVVVRMGRTAIPLAPLVVTARSRHPLAGFYERVESRGPGKFVLREFIARRPAARPSQLLVMTPGVRLLRSDDNTTTAITLPAPGGRCEPSVYLDGLPVPPGLTTIDDLTAAEMIEGIEVYDYGAKVPDIFPIPAESGCGVVAYWSRREARRPMTWWKWALGVTGIAAFYLLTTGLQN